MTSRGTEAIRLLAEVLYVEPERVDLDSNFPELGLDSILAVEYVAQLKASVGYTATIAELYDLGTPRALLDRLGASS
ncbi:acyl carrier protein [Actinophytocola gossypii]|uniref:Acyl carrier protein n=1 Tax=Actinophytocola gossypii TaxID=2812003 RepID=A0ABT2J5H9_9PSEU|nr:acyl carrier protein [Actinophytocola gossypii]MCT2583117.1 acyl carrier protein [Actinophytocola gossypii]